MLHRLDWRYATKEFDPEKVLEEEVVTELLKVMNLSASSYGLQPYEFIVIKNKDLQEKLVEVSFGQRQVVDASHLIVIAAKTEVDDAYIDAYIANIAKIREQKIQELEGYSQMMKGAVGSKPQSEQLIWAQKQCYIALGSLLIAAADAKIDACPMEGFDPEAYNEILGLDKEGLHATLVVPLGYRAITDGYQHLAKVRKPLGDMVQLKYK